MFEIRIPATSANMGPSFDCLGIALNMYNHFSFTERTEGLSISDCKPEYINNDNLVYTAMQACLNKLGHKLTGISINIHRTFLHFPRLFRLHHDSSLLF